MHVHFDKKLVFLLHPKTASRAIRTVLEDRGFVMVGTHHAGVDEIAIDAIDPEASKRDNALWDLADPNEFKYACVVRNQFDTLLTWFWNSSYWKEAAPNKMVHLAYVSEFPWSPKPYWPVRGQLWRFIWDEYPNMTILRYENLRHDLDEFLVQGGLKHLDEDEFQVQQLHLTKRKPRDGWESHWDEDAREHVEKLYAAELKRLGYNFLSNDK